MKVVIFCGGLGVRMGEETQKIPKPMIAVGGHPILWHIMKWYASWGHDDFVLCLGYKGEGVKEYFLSYNEALSNDFILSNGGRDVELLGTDISSWRITFVDTGKAVDDRRAARRGRAVPRGRRVLPRDLRRRPHGRPAPGHGRAAPIVGQDGPLSLGQADVQRPRREGRRRRRRPCGRGHPAGGRADQRRLLRLPAGDPRLHQSRRGARRGTVPAADRRGRADCVPPRRLLGADGHDQGQATPGRAREQRQCSVAGPVGRPSGAAAP